MGSWHLAQAKQLWWYILPSLVVTAYCPSDSLHLAHFLPAGDEVLFFLIFV
jgi:hypothetical protein